MDPTTEQRRRGETWHPEATAERLQQAMKRLRARLRSESGQHATGLSAGQRAVLTLVVDQGPLTAARIAELEHVSPQAIAQNLAELKERGLVRTEPDPRDGRKKLIHAEGSGGELIDALRTGRSSFLSRAIDQVIAPEERAELAKAVELLERLADADLDRGPT